MNRLRFLLVGVVVGIAIAAVVGGAFRQPPVRIVLAASMAPPFVPACPHPTYSPDGNVSPLFCKIDNPVALKFYEPLAPNVFALGPNATPVQVTTALNAAHSRYHPTGPETCALYALAAWRWHWNFSGIDPASAYYC